MLPEPIQSALVGIARRFEAAGIPYALGGSAMLRLAGFDVGVNDIDIVVDGSSQAAVVAMLPNYTEPQSTDPWRSSWFLHTEWPLAHSTVGVDIIGQMALIIDGTEVVFPFDADTVVSVGGANVPLVPLRHWYHLYRVHDPAKAVLVAQRLGDEEIMTGATELGISDIFSPTLIVRIGGDSRIGNDSQDQIEEDMSSDVQSSIIEVASPTDQSFDEPGSETIDRDLLNETLEYVRPALQADGGDLILLGTEGGKVTLQLVGACGGCPLSTMTLTSGIERILQDRVPGVTSVVSV